MYRDPNWIWIWIYPVCDHSTYPIVRRGDQWTYYLDKGLTTVPRQRPYYLDKGPIT